MDTKQAVNTYSLKELATAPTGVYKLVPGNEPNDLFAIYPGLKERAIFIDVSFRGEPTIQVVYYDHQYRNNKGSMSLVLEDNEQFSWRGTNNNNRDILGSIGRLKITIDYYVFCYGKDDNNKKLVELDGKFYRTVCSMPLDVNYFTKGESTKGVAYILSSFRNIGANYTDLAQTKRLAEYLASEMRLGIDFTLPAKTEGVAKTVAAVLPFYNASTNTLGKCAFHIAATSGNRTIKALKFSSAFNALFAGITTQEAFDQKLDELCEIATDASEYDNFKNFLEKVLDNLPEARDMQKAAIKRKSTGAFNKIMDDLDFVNIEVETHPLTHAAVFGGDLPLGTFFRKNGDSYFMYNDNWDLWEEMLASHRELAIEIASEASRRTTFEKDIMSYFYFVLHGLPEYLEEHTGKKWTGIPRLVKSSSELEPPKAGSSGTAKTRSAMTPIVDNENNTITVPYVSMATAGYSTTYTYALDFNVLKRGFNHQGYTVTKDVEKELNGRDDYGLMFYTLTGSDNGKGYPTFLIIFERLTDSTKAHFHRTHPTRSKQGEGNPVHNWTKGCYQWMVGNVNFERIKAQQGDLAFVQIDELPKGDTELVNGYDSHMFDRPVPFVPYTKKEASNILGYVYLDADTPLRHNEHLDRVIPAGHYEIRQARSWEANPKGVWSLRID